MISVARRAEISIHGGLEYMRRMSVNVKHLQRALTIDVTSQDRVTSEVKTLKQLY